MTRRLLPIALLVIFTLAAVGPIRNYDLFWHLATGRWIAEQKALPDSDPFAIASDRGEWINGEWLFELLLHWSHALLGLANLSWLRALMIGGTFAIAFHFARARNDPHIAAALAALAFAGAMQTIDLRPSGLAAMFIVLAIAGARAERHQTLTYALLTILWINIHPSALLAPLIALIVTRRITLPVVSALALLVNPHGWHGVLAPLRLLTFVGGGTFVNAEWLPSDPRLFPMLYVTVALTVVTFVLDKERDWSRILLTVLFAYLAIRHVRHQPLWYAAFPLVAARVPRVPRAAACALAAAAVIVSFLTTGHHRGVSPERFPIEAVARLQSTGLRGNIYNPDQFGGFLIWSFYPERRVLTDGRNELYRAYIPEFARARRDNRAWRALLDKYRITLAVDEYRAPLEVVNTATGQTQHIPASLAYWPRKQWALIGYDRAAMVFARRSAFAPEVLGKWELKNVVPDAEKVR